MMDNGFGIGSESMTVGADFGKIPDEGGINRRNFCSTMAALAAVGPTRMIDHELSLTEDVSKSSTISSSITKSFHQIFFEAAQDMGRVKDSSVDLVVTSPPYPMIEMWDGIFAMQNHEIAEAMGRNPDSAFELMHRELDKIWIECFRALKNGGIMCVNIGDATRTVNKGFRLYNNHSRVVSACLNAGFVNLPNIIWRKQTNAPNKFMGSGMLPCGAYVTLEHEWILIFRKGGKRSYKSEREKNLRRCSAFFWEERNKWFSDIWDVKGTRQTIVNSQTRDRNASFPLEIPFRLVNMYSQFGDVVLDPFMGMGTTMVASMLTGRNSLGFEIDRALKPSICNYVESVDAKAMDKLVSDRIERHHSFVKERISSGKNLKYKNLKLDCLVMTSQETDMELVCPKEIKRIDGDDFSYGCSY